MLKNDADLALLLALPLAALLQRDGDIVQARRALGFYEARVPPAARGANFAEVRRRDIAARIAAAESVAGIVPDPDAPRWSPADLRACFERVQRDTAQRAPAGDGAAPADPVDASLA